MIKIHDECYSPVDISWLAEEFEMTPRRLQQIIQERRVPRAGHGKVRLADGLLAIMRTTEASIARGTAKTWTDDRELQDVITWALMIHARGRGAKLAELAEPELHRAKAKRRVARATREAGQ